MKAAEDAIMIQAQTSDATVACIYFPEKLGYSAHRAQADCCSAAVLHAVYPGPQHLRNIVYSL